MDFTTIDYLKTGTARQREAYSVLIQSDVLVKLERYTPLLVGTVPINIDLETSDLDVICYWTDQRAFYADVFDNFKDETAFSIRENSEPGREVVIASFRIAAFEIEIFGQNIPTQQQMGYRHMLIEHRLLTERGEDFRQAVIALKRKGYKTEPAFGQLLGFKDDPYTALLAYETR